MSERTRARESRQTPAPSITGHNSDTLRQRDRRILERRLEHLEERIANGERDGRSGLSYDRQELAALRRLLSERS